MLPVLKYNGIDIARNIEFSRTILKQTLGLMFRKGIPIDHSMIFVLKKPSQVSIHMLFVFFPIDVIFLNEKKEITGLSRLRPWVGYKAMESIKYIIEMKAGTIEMFHLCKGGQMEFEDN
ncbi:MAG: DUF192 domain-containing protein [Candidatus Methanoperedens sp.]|nr:DUF192 domain-containing protein [Candidatus Methanoperedens sp.]